MYVGSSAQFILQLRDKDNHLNQCLEDYTKLSFFHFCTCALSGGFSNNDNIFLQYKARVFRQYFEVRVEAYLPEVGICVHILRLKWYNISRKIKKDK